MAKTVDKRRALVRTAAADHHADQPRGSGATDITRIADQPSRALRRLDTLVTGSIAGARYLRAAEHRALPAPAGFTAALMSPKL